MHGKKAVENKGIIERKRHIDLLRSARGIWKDRTDLDHLKSIRDELNQDLEK